MKHTSEFYIFAHRGGHSRHPENTLPAIQHALDLKARWIELDVQYHTPSDELLIFHDFNLKRVAHHPGQVQQQPLSVLQNLDLGQGTRIPTVSQVLNEIKGQAGINFDVRTRSAMPKLIRLIESYWQKYGGPESAPILVSSFWHDEIKQLKQLAPHIPRGLLIAGRLVSLEHWTHSLEPFSIHYDASFLDAALIQATQRVGYRAFAYTVNEKTNMETLKNFGIDGFFTDEPLLAQQICLP